MSDEVVAAVASVVAGDTTFDALRGQTQEQVVAACAATPFVLTAPAVARVLAGFANGGISATAAQQWAAFVSRGMLPGAQSGQALDIDYEADAEAAIVEAVVRLDELGDVVDGSLSREEAEQLIAALFRAS